MGVNQGDVVDVRRTERRVQQFQAETYVHSPSVGLDFLSDRMVLFGLSGVAPGVYIPRKTVQEYF